MKKEDKQIHIDILLIRESFQSAKDKYELLVDRFNKKLSYQEIGTSHGISKQAAQQTVVKTIEKLYEYNEDYFRDLEIESLIKNEDFFFVDLGVRQKWLIAEVVKYAISKEAKGYELDIGSGYFYKKEWAEKAKKNLVEKCFKKGLPCKIETLDDEAAAEIFDTDFIVEDDFVCGVLNIENSKKDIINNFMLYAKNVELICKDTFEEDFKVFLSHFKIFPKAIFDKMFLLVMTKPRHYMHLENFEKLARDKNVDIAALRDVIMLIEGDIKQDTSLVLLLKKYKEENPVLFENEEIINIYSFGSLIRLYTSLNVNLIRQVVSMKKIKLFSASKNDLVLKIVEEHNTTDTDFISYIAKRDYGLTVSLPTIYKALRTLKKA